MTLDVKTSPVMARRVRRSRQWSLIWLVPALAVLIAAGLGYQAWRTQGAQIVVEFATASGLEAGKTRVRYKDVEVGKVVKVALNEDMTRVRATLAMDRAVAASLRSDARFWVVRPRVTTRTISGLSTLLSGSYVSLLPGDTGDARNEYLGLEEPPNLSGLSEGSQFWLTADRLGSMDVGSPLFYRGIVVGEVASYTLDADERMRIQVFVRSPYDRLVKSSTRFWNVKGLAVKMGTDGLQAEFESMLSFMQGGVAFETLPQWGEAQSVGEGHVFALYPDRDSIAQQTPNVKLHYVMTFEGNLSGLGAGAVVQHRGLEVGRVLDVQPEFDTQALQLRVPVLVELWPERLAMPADAERAKGLLMRMVDQGLRAQLKPASLITGQVMVDLDYLAEAGKVQLAEVKGHTHFPTVPATMEQVVKTLGNVMAQLEKAPIAQTVEELRQAAAGLKTLLDKDQASSVLRQTEQLLAQVNQTMAGMQQLPSTLDATLKQTQTTLATLNTSLQQANTALAEDSLLQHDVRTLMQEVARAAGAVETLADTLQRQPNAILFGKE